jgi:hypothetical protein
MVRGQPWQLPKVAEDAVAVVRRGLVQSPAKGLRKVGVRVRRLPCVAEGQFLPQALLGSPLARIASFSGRGLGQARYRSGVATAYRPAAQPSLGALSSFRSALGVCTIFRMAKPTSQLNGQGGAVSTLRLLGCISLVGRGLRRPMSRDFDAPAPGHGVAEVALEASMAQAGRAAW